MDNNVTNSLPKPDFENTKNTENTSQNLVPLWKTTNKLLTILKECKNTMEDFKTQYVNIKLNCQSIDNPVVMNSAWNGITNLIFALETCYELKLKHLDEAPTVIVPDTDPDNITSSSLALDLDEDQGFHDDKQNKRRRTLFFNDDEDDKEMK
jgi:hypothetical protein